MYQTTGIEVKRTAMRDFCQRHSMRPYRPTYRYLRGNPEKQRVAQEELEALKKSPGGGVRAAEPRRGPLSPGADVTGHAGGEGLRPLVGTWDNKDQVYCFAALNVVTGQLTTRLLEQPARSKAKTGQSKQQRLQVAFAAHLRDIARAYPASAVSRGRHHD